MSFVRRTHILTTSFGVAACFVAALVAACSGSTASIDGADAGAASSSGASSSSSSSSSSSGGVDGSVSLDSGGQDGATNKDAASTVIVNEKPAPVCHDLTQRATLVTPIGNANPPPAQVPITTVAPGLYVLVSAIDYGGATPIDPVVSLKTTVVFTATRQYYLSQDGNGNGVQALTLDWTIVNNRLIRKVLCSQQAAQIGSTVDYRIDGAANGFIVYVPSTGSGPPRLHGYRYDRIE